MTREQFTRGRNEIKLAVAGAQGSRRGGKVRDDHHPAQQSTDERLNAGVGIHDGNSGHRLKFRLQTSL